jgi:hypothetical protein
MPRSWSVRETQTTAEKRWIQAHPPLHLLLRHLLRLPLVLRVLLLAPHALALFMLPI